MRTWLVLVSCLVLGAFVLGEVSAQNARAVAMGGAFVGLADDVNAAMYNPAAIAMLERPEVTASSGSSSSDSQSFLACVLPSSRSAWSFAASVQRIAWDSGLGYDNRQDYYRAAAAYRLSPKTSAGISVKLTDFSQPGISADPAVDLSLFHVLNDKWSVGLSILDVNEPTTKLDDDVFAGPESFKFSCTLIPGVSYRPSENTVLAFDLYHIGYYIDGWVYEFGVEHVRADGLALRGGFSGVNGDMTTSLGIGKSFGKYTVDAAYANDGWGEMALLSVTGKY